MKARIIIAPNGTIGFFVDEGSFEEASVKLTALVATLRNLGIEITGADQVEQHRHDHAHEHLHVAADH